jgi:hypothetical protein
MQTRKKDKLYNLYKKKEPAKQTPSGIIEK